jgi:hypothetical protein
MSMVLANTYVLSAPRWADGFGVRWMASSGFCPVVTDCGSATWAENERRYLKAAAIGLREAEKLRIAQGSLAEVIETDPVRQTGPAR